MSSPIPLELTTHPGSKIHYSSSSTTHTQKTYLTTTNPFEQKFRYHRAVRKGPFIFVAGTTALKDDPLPEAAAAATDDGDHPGKTTDEVTTGEEEDPKEKESKVHYPSSAYRQSLVTMKRCISAVEKLGGQLRDVVRVRMFVAYHDDCLDVGLAYRDCFGGGGGGGDDEEEGDNRTIDDVGAVATMIVVNGGFVDPDIRVEVEVDAVCS